MAYSQYSEHRRPPAVPKVRRVEHFDKTDADDLKTRKNFEKAIEATTPKAKPSRSFADLVKKK